MSDTEADDIFYDCEQVIDVLGKNSSINDQRNKAQEQQIIVNDESKKENVTKNGDIEVTSEQHEFLSIDNNGTTMPIDKKCNEEIVEDKEDNMTDEEKQICQNKALDLKIQGNEKFRSKEFKEASVLYSEAIQLCPHCCHKDLSVIYSNRAACWMKLEKKEDAVKDSTKAIELNSEYIKPLLRRAQLYEDLEKLDEAFVDYKTLIEKDPSLSEPHVACRRLEEKINERNEKLKQEMMGKLKDLGNLVLRPFGLSTNNFQLQQNTDSGSYNIQFVNNPPSPNNTN